MASLTELRARVRVAIHDTNAKFIGNDELDDWFNEALLDLQARYKLLHAEYEADMGDAGTSVADGTIDLPADFISAITLRLSDDDARLVDDEEFWNYTDAGSNPGQTLYRVFNDKLELYPAPSSGTTFKLRYAKKPEALSDGADVPGLPEELHIKLVHYAKAHAFIKKDDMGKADRYLALYEEGVPPLNPASRLMPGPFVMSMEAGPWDSAEASHL